MEQAPEAPKKLNVFARTRPPLAQPLVAPLEAGSALDRGENRQNCSASDAKFRPRTGRTNIDDLVHR
jgi:hypothetical protein